MSKGLIMAGLLLVTPSLATAGDLSNGDPVAGELVYENCTGCHSIDANRVGPMHRGVVGRAASIMPDFEYSPALKAAGVTWDEASLDRWLANSKDFVPGSKMGFRLSSPTDRADVIAYLRTLR